MLRRIGYLLEKFFKEEGCKKVEAYAWWHETLSKNSDLMDMASKGRQIIQAHKVKEISAKQFKARIVAKHFYA